MKHKHEFTRSRKSSTVETCNCGKFRYTENAGPAIVCKYGPGVTLPNGAEIIAIKPSTTKGWSVVLASIDDGSGYATWNMDNENGECQSGHYFDYPRSVSELFTDAKSDFKERN